MSLPLNVVILGAGKGTRMYSEQPKVLHKLAGKPLLQHTLDSSGLLNPHKTIVVYGYGGNAVPEAINNPDYIWVQQSEQLGTGHALMQTVSALDSEGITLVLYGDVPLTQVNTLKTLVAIAGENRLGLLTIELANADGYGRIVRNKNGGVLRIVEHKDANEQERSICEINTGIMAIPTKHLLNWLKNLSNNNAQKEYYLTDIIEMAVNDNVEVVTSHPDHEWEILGINSKVQLAQVERLYQTQIAHTLLAQGVTLMDPARIDVRGDLVCGKEVLIDVNCIFEGKVQLGDGVVVGAHCVIRNSTVAAGTRLEPFTILDQCETGLNNKIGPFSRIRPGTQLKEDVHVGNFVEIKNSQVDSGSKINHLSYVGDSTVGKRVNVGAGTITCNYDGANKHRTIIEDDVFIGSDTQLVAPVTVSKGATIGAGSTITRDTPEGELSLSRSKQVTVTGWKRPVKKAKQ
ncbi:bifunctional UDP-N-acetylglucosamine diphosphorylase/glucosamine-1-phosphate N-acetyltransferase GlmU [Sulfurirhabdus autotrophica]|uniref:Bifunctional protein GlmU n=1 Tax=Sulfurirhabdus autotrophica TaxID=1706046 RepID=A0A4V2W0Z1_9PROT|nr:bifunctional UDP-N-acetylglucosamine diphosphorylase/glucosamine-1-phosphate N-acetyltransferase GlmU [Sulfurirhabdus autotrophica]TCV82219.1 UDP-N-acetylglucosamine pyrophosphorylase /glucosamine-1-phosphate N-acetyltransferase [Sulfurirhabdus autotrophica]